MFEPAGADTAAGHAAVAAEDDPLTPAGLYRAATRAGDLLVSAGMTPRRGDVLVARGIVGADIGLDEAVDLATLAGSRAVRAVLTAANPTTESVSAVQLTVYIRATADFTQHSQVADGASKAISSLLAGSAPTRAAVGVSSLPGGAPVEVVLTAIATRLPSAQN